MHVVKVIICGLDVSFKDTYRHTVASGGSNTRATTSLSCPRFERLKRESKSSRFCGTVSTQENPPWEYQGKVFMPATPLRDNLCAHD